ncbi:hypothetical protein ASF43_07880 [Pseudorhodoferax sp. Leaf267]|nr:hypothetical protein ASF43_07880 [Pseudorhodoferax sp. Leaf267]
MAQIEQLVRISRELGLPIATAAQARELLDRCVHPLKERAALFTVIGLAAWMAHRQAARQAGAPQDKPPLPWCAAAFVVLVAVLMRLLVGP